MKGSLVNRIDVDDDNESSHIVGSTQAAAPSLEEVTEGVVRNSGTNKSHHGPRNDQPVQTSSTVSDVVNHTDFDDIEAAPPSLSRQEPISAAAPHVTFNRPHRRMLVDVDAFVDIENDEDVSKSVDDPVPSVMPNPQRSASQNAAIKAVLGHDNVDKGERDDIQKFYNKPADACGESVTGHTADLSEDEIAAIIPPNLQRHGGGHISTPGAFAVPGRGGVVSIASTRTFNSTRRSHTDLVEYGDGIHMISATLVGFQGSDMNQDEPMLVYAERLWWKRRLVLCVGAWMLLAVTAISVSITLAVIYFNDTDKTLQSPVSNVPISNASDEGTDSTNVTSTPTAVEIPSNSPSKSPIDLTPSPVPMSLSPSTQSPIAITEPLETIVSMHAASWGVFTSCIDFDNEVQSYEIVLRCGGNITLEKYNNIDCSKSAVDQGKLTCRLKSSEPFGDTSTNDLYQRAFGLALFSCNGTAEIDLVAGIEFSNVTVSNCSQASTIGTASSFVSIGRFCQDENNLEFFDIIGSECDNGNSCTVRSPSAQTSNFGNNDDRQLDFFDNVKDTINDIGDGITEFIDGIFSFCYETTSCSDQTTPSQACNLAVQKVASSSLDECKSNPGSAEADVDSMWNISQTALDPLTRMEVFIQDILQ